MSETPHRPHNQRFRRHRLRRSREDGAVLVEFAVIFPLLLVLLLGIVDFGVNLSNQISIRQGAREAARQGAVANFGPTASCGAHFASSGSENIRRLICMTKQRSDVTASDVRVAIRFDPAANGYTVPGANGPVGNSLLVCSVVPMKSVSGMFSFMMNDEYLRTKTVMRIEQASGVAETAAHEADPTGASWSWCTP